MLTGSRKTDETRWKSVILDDELHIVPDGEEHDFSDDCGCRPHCEDMRYGGYLVAHLDRNDDDGLLGAGDEDPA